MIRFSLRPRLIAALMAVGALTAAAPAVAGAKTYRALSIVTINEAKPLTTARRETELEWTAPRHDGTRTRYILQHQYADRERPGGPLLLTTWFKQNLTARSAVRVEIVPRRRTWAQRTVTIGKTRHPVGIRSSAQAVRQAIEEGTANPFGLTRLDGQRVRLLYLVPTFHNQRTTELWVNWKTDRPVRESETTTAGPGGRYAFTAVSNWEHISRRKLDRLRARPKVPKGYTVSR